MAAPARYNLTQPLPKFRQNLNFDIVVKFQNDRHKDRKISRGSITRARKEKGSSFNCLQRRCHYVKPCKHQ